MSNQKEEKPNVDLYYSISITLLGLINYSEDHIVVNDTGNLKMNNVLFKSRTLTSGRKIKKKCPNQKTREIKY